MILTPFRCTQCTKDFQGTLDLAGSSVCMQCRRDTESKVAEFKAGDVVECVEANPEARLANNISFGDKYTVINDDAKGYVRIEDDRGCEVYVMNHRFKLVTSATPAPAQGATSSTAVLPTDSATRKNIPIASGVLGYFPLAAAYVALVSKVGNDQHNPGQPLHWAREKSTDHADCIARHLVDRGTVDTDKLRHSGKLAWRALANLQVELEAAIASGEDPFSL